jgi:2-(1,2-epoxy-1,2-dihydrophenyl)acetyl-CoA isomerase
MSAQGEVHVEYDDEIALVTIDRPERRNALSATLAAEVKRVIDEASQRCRAVILTGTQGSFCAGGDLDELELWSEMTPEDIGSRLYSSFQGMVRSIRNSPAIVIAAVDGAAVGAGMDLALACDLRVASTSARFGQVWVKLGVIPGTGGAWLTRALIGQTRAAEMLLTGDLIDADTALSWGLVNAIVEPPQLLDEARGLAAKILRHPRDGVIANKQALVAASASDFETALEHAAKVQPLRFTSEEFRRAVRSSRS